MPHFKLILAYDGTPYRGWQIQPALPTVQGTLSDAIHRTTGERVLPQGSGRTDAGVHALAQVASFSLAAPIPPANLHRALNRCLPPSIRILTASLATPHFHARHSALQKTYEYRIFPLRPTPPPSPRPSQNEGVPHPSRRDGWDVSRSTADDLICPPSLAPYVYPCPWPLDIEALNAAAQHVLGTHDFTTFAAADPDQITRAERSSLDTREDAVIPTGGGAANAVEGSPHLSFARTITHSHWHTRDNLLVYTVIATGFLHHMVRNLVGTFIQAGARRLDPSSIPSLLAARNRGAAGPTAPPTGLFLLSVEYAPDSQITTHNSQLPS